MFVKIQKWEVSKTEDKTVTYKQMERETVYHVSTFQLSSNPENQEMIAEMTLDNGNNEVYCFPWEKDTEVIEVYYMNDSGKTIDHLIY